MRLIEADKLPQGDTTLFSGRENKKKVLAFVAIALQAATLANHWGPPVVVGENGDIAYDWGGFRPELPIPGGPNGLIPGLDPDLLHPAGTWTWQRIAIVVALLGVGAYVVWRIK